MSWHFSQELGGAFSVDTYLAGIQSARWSLSHTRETSCCSDRETDSSPHSPSGTMFAPLTENHGTDSLTLSAEASPAKTFPQQEKEPVLTENAADFGERCTESFARYDRSTHSWKTPQCSLLADLDVFSETWPKQGIMLHGLCWELTMWEPRTSANASGFSRETFITPSASEGLRSKFQLTSMAKRREKHNFGNLTEQVARRLLFPTATCKGLDGGSHAREALHKAAPTESKQMLGGHLNPTWVEWLMGWPLGWTDLNPLETDKYLSWQQQHSISLINY